MSRYDYGWRPYVPVGMRQANARRNLSKHLKPGTEIQPVERITGRGVARSFWGKGWCDHLDSFGDFSNRLPRGKTYVRNGSVCHLAIDKGQVEAFVAGSELYKINITIKPLAAVKWTALKKQCSGKIGSLVELLQGRLSDEIMNVVTDRETGLFPQPGEIKYDCDCPDWADMCKHIAAVIYGIGARLDDRPELLFLLRGVDHEELIDGDAATANIAAGASGRRSSRRKTLAGDDLEGVFGVELEPDAAPTATRPRKKTSRKIARKNAAKKTTKTTAKKTPKKAAKSTAKKPTKKLAKKAAKKQSVFRPTGRAVAKLRQQLGMSKSALAREIGVSPPTISNWENTKGSIHPHTPNLDALKRLHARVQ